MNTKKKRDSVSIRACSCRRAEGKMHISLTVANESDQPCFIIPRVRRVQMNPDTGVLSVWFSATGRAEPETLKMRREFTAPKTEAVPERTERTVTASLPEDMTRLVPHADGTFHLEAMDLTKATDIEIHAAVDDKPFYFSPERKDYLNQLVRWGRPLMARSKVEGSLGPDQRTSN